jgi:hypothetical protein
MSAYDLSTHLGAYLYEQNHFRPNGLVAFVGLEVLTGYMDTSGNAKTVTDTVLTVNGCLSTPEKWAQFDKEWQAYLKGKDFTPDLETGRYVFHTTDYKANKCNFMPKGLSERFKTIIYGYLVELIRKHTVFRFGYGVLLNDFRQFETDFPHVRAWFQKPGTYLSKECFEWNSNWAQRHGFDGSIGYIVDRGDEFAGELFSEYFRAVKHLGSNGLTVSSLTAGNKVHHSPLQAADIVAWESRNHYLKLTPDHISGLLRSPRPSYAAGRLNVRGQSDLRLYSYKDLQTHLHEKIEPHLSPKVKEYVGDGKQFSMDEVARHVLSEIERERVATARAQQAKRKENHMKNKEAEFENFDKAVGSLLTVSHTELKKRLDEEKKAKEKKKQKTTCSSDPASSGGSSH